MYSWKNRFKFGKSKEEKEKDKETKHSGFFHHSSSSTSLSNQDELSHEKSKSITPIDSRKETITNSDSVMVPTRSSYDANSSSTSTFGADPNINRNSSNATPVQNNQTSSSGIMTIKIYNGSDFVLPFHITSNEQILTKLLASGANRQEEQNNQPLPSIDQLASQLSKAKISGQSPSGDEVLIPGDVASKFIPSTIKLPGSSNLNPLLYFTIEFDNTVATIEPEYGTMEKPTFNKISTFDVTRKLSFLKIDVFARIPSILLPSKTWQHEVSSSNQALKDIFHRISSNQDIHLDSFQLPLNLKIDSAANIRLYNHHWVELENSLGKINLSIDYKPSKNKALSIDDFDLLKVIGKGSFGKVMQVRKKDTQKIYALKAIRKSYIVSKSEVTHTLAERTVLARVDCPFIVPLKFSFQSPEKLYLVLACINGGELFYHLQREGRFDLSRSRFYAAELLCALETLHKFDVIYRDLKPENILLDYQGHIALCDFGLCKLNMKDDDKTDTFCGTPEYLAPELLLGQGYTKVVDWWTLGVLLYEMLTGLPPYYDEDVPKMYKKILQEPLRFPDGFDKDAKDLLIGLLSRDPTRRLGLNGADEIKNHPFFSQLNWKRLLMKGYIPPYKPSVSNAMDTSNFDQEFTQEKPIDSVVDEYLSESVQKQFGGWTYVGSEQLGSSVIQGRSIK
ncbi:hypothetical protein KAFR_0D03020 [Kazachstania africana CBS 2517]|uniref:non-specific serine/threonine protein kinase n=1 Tax=Kazachstania africana (strain ATCC 22294 / BCRC 22015 / CBS 2517 / CECT 1963 / NBRC 1671 / NRRL Y-8276) TaxID=1071382 RepID=H2AUA0_KAZAF|nr:hypothetical protein KAFR_0D03020 [Kazachstania africana CBS 2517]CCF57950.1 hypothetical protein KAFR_0D03020 [Kazachstania africana CBS 2517]